MPEIGEVARIVSYIHKHLVGKTLSVVKAQHDENVFGKVGTTAAEFEKALTGKKVLDAKQQGKYFWLVMSSPPHPLCHFGMAGWFKIRNDETAYYKPTNPSDPSEWPPKYWKFAVETLESPKVEAAFVDFRRFARVRLLDCPAEEMRNTTPLKENGPDPVVDKDVVTVEWLSEKLRSKKIPVKALLLDQANISGIGNWVGDELLYDARIHPEQYSNTLTDAQIKQLHKSLHYVCSLAVETKVDSSKFPESWLFKHRWGKGKKDSPNRLPNGEKIVFLTVGGRTSAVIPSVQKKTGPVKADVKSEDQEDGKEDADETDEGREVPQKPKQRSTSNKKNVKTEVDAPESKPESVKPTRKRPSRAPRDDHNTEEPALLPAKRKSIPIPPQTLANKRKQPSRQAPVPAENDIKDEEEHEEEEAGRAGKEEVAPHSDHAAATTPPPAKRQNTTKKAAGKKVTGTRSHGVTKKAADAANGNARRRSARVNGVDH